MGVFLSLSAAGEREEEAGEVVWGDGSGGEGKLSTSPALIDLFKFGLSAPRLSLWLRGRAEFSFFGVASAPKLDTTGWGGGIRNPKIPPSLLVSFEHAAKRGWRKPKPFLLRRDHGARGRLAYLLWKKVWTWKVCQLLWMKGIEINHWSDKKKHRLADVQIWNAPLRKALKKLLLDSCPVL